MVLRRFARARFYGLCTLPLLIAGCATPAATSANTETSLWQRMAWWRESAPPTMGPSTNGPVRIAETPAPKKLRDPAKLNLAYGRWREQIGELSEARHAYETVLKKEPKSVDAILGIARIDLLAGRVRESEAGFQRAVALKPNDSYALAALGEFYASQQRWPDAIRNLESALSQAKSDASVEQSDKAKIEYQLALAMARSGDIPGSLPHFANSVGEAEGHYNVGRIQYEKGQMTAAAEHFEQALRLRPDLHEAQLLLEEIRRPASGMQLASGVKLSSSNVQNSGGFTGSRPLQQSTSVQPGTAAQQPLTPPVGIASTRTLGNSTQHSTRLPVASQLAAPNSANASPSGVNAKASPANMTPQQREQWENQFGEAVTTP